MALSTFCELSQIRIWGRSCAEQTQQSNPRPVPLFLSLSLSHFTDYTDRAAENGGGGGGGRVIDVRRSNGRGRRRGRRGGGELRVSDFEGEGGK